jgi:diguanylate cyclase (GGDEF)-like protein
MRPADLAYRYGGEEFVLILPEISITGTMVLAENIRKNVESLDIPHEGSKVASHLTISIGIASLVPTSGEMPTTLVSLADAALYRAKEAGRNRVVESAG